MSEPGVERGKGGKMRRTVYSARALQPASFFESQCNCIPRIRRATAAQDRMLQPAACNSSGNIITFGDLGPLHPSRLLHKNRKQDPDLVTEIRKPRVDIDKKAGKYEVSMKKNVL